MERTRLLSSRRCDLRLLRGTYSNLQVDGVLILLEVRGATLPNLESDADPTRRHAVRLTSVSWADAAGPLRDPLDRPGCDRDRVGPFGCPPVSALRLQRRERRSHRATAVDVAVALGNIVLCDHGASQNVSSADRRTTGPVPIRFSNSPHPRRPVRDRRDPRSAVRFRPFLAAGPVTQQGTIPNHGTTPTIPCRTSSDDHVRSQGPSSRSVRVVDGRHGRPSRWASRTSPCGSPRGSRSETSSACPPRASVRRGVDDDGRAALRFGDGTFGMRPPQGTVFLPRYRTGNGAAGNVGTGAISAPPDRQPGSGGELPSHRPGSPAIWNHSPRPGAQPGDDRGGAAASAVRLPNPGAGRDPGRRRRRGQEAGHRRPA